MRRGLVSSRWGWGRGGWQSGLLGCLYAHKRRGEGGGVPYSVGASKGIKYWAYSHLLLLPCPRLPSAISIRRPPPTQSTDTHKRAHLVVRVCSLVDEELRHLQVAVLGGYHE